VHLFYFFYTLVELTKFAGVMAILLNIDCSGPQMYVSLTDDDKILAEYISEQANNHAASIHKAIDNLITQAGITLQQLSAVAVMNGPGSYTGLRIGLATAKGYCFSLEKPLILVSNLDAIAFEYMQHHDVNKKKWAVAISPMKGELLYNTYLGTKNNQSYQFGRTEEILLNLGGIDFILGDLEIDFQLNFPQLNVLNYDKNIKNINILSSHYYGNFLFSDLLQAEPYYLKNTFLKVPKKL
jgi:tRNA threonylcarbamoyladenosine biosynthesis protein TsaB